MEAVLGQLRDQPADNRNAGDENFTAELGTIGKVGFHMITNYRRNVSVALIIRKPGKTNFCLILSDHRQSLNTIFGDRAVVCDVWEPSLKFTSYFCK